MGTTLVCYQNHFDLVWRRCWERTFEQDGLVWRSYADVETAWLDRCLDLARTRGAAFQIEQAATLRMWLGRRPSVLPLLRELAAAGRFAVLGAGEATIDVNMCRGETMVRNLASAIHWLERTLGQGPITAAHPDGFGSSAQFPQAARICGLRGIDSLSYSKPDASYWRGLDGSTVWTAFDRPGMHAFNDHCYYEPCLDCRGHGADAGQPCLRCEGSGLRLSQGVYPVLAAAPPAPGVLGRFLQNSEEMMPDPQLPGTVAARQAAGEDWRWATDAAFLPAWEPYLALVDDPAVQRSSRVENNPVQSGCLVSRIRVKQAARAAEGRFYAAERLCAAAGVAQRARLEEAWLRLPLLFFHDAVTGTHIDPAQSELLDQAAACVAEATAAAGCAFTRLYPGTPDHDHLAVFNPHPFAADLPVVLADRAGCWAVLAADATPQAVHRQGDDSEPVTSGIRCIADAYRRLRDACEPQELRFCARSVPALSTAVYHIVPAPAEPWETLPETGTAGLDDLRMAWDAHGVVQVWDAGEELLDAKRGRFAGLLLEEDVGDPWGTRHVVHPRQDLSSCQHLVLARRRRAVIELVYDGVLDNGPFGNERDPRVFGLHWRQTIRLCAGLPWIALDLEVFWQTQDRRLRVVFPSRSISDDGQYGIPAGELLRARYEQTGTSLWSPNGDWPGLHYAATLPGPHGPGLAVVDTGTPSYRVEDGVLMASVLRSPGFPHCLSRYAQEHPLPTGGQRDAGRHLFRFAVLAHRSDAVAQVRRAAELLNTPAPVAAVPAGATPWCSGWRIEAEDVELSALKSGFAGAGTCLRLTERRGIARDVRIGLPAGTVSVHVADACERQGDELPISGGTCTLAMRAWGIHTLIITRTGQGG